MTESPASVAATALIAEFIAAGVTDLVLSPGSRSQALALATGNPPPVGLRSGQLAIDFANPFEMRFQQIPIERFRMVEVWFVVDF